MCNKINTPYTSPIHAHYKNTCKKIISVYYYDYKRHGGLLMKSVLTLSVATVALSLLTTPADANPYLNCVMDGNLRICSETKQIMYQLEPAKWGCDYVEDVEAVLTAGEEALDAAFMNKVRDNKCWFFPLSEPSIVTFVTRVGSVAIVEWKATHVAIPMTIIQETPSIERPARNKQGKLIYK